MHNIQFSEAFEGFYDLLKIIYGFALGHYFVRCTAVVLHYFFQCSTITIFINKVVVVNSFKHIDILDNVGVLFYFS
jgi:hypothetical protein